MKTPKELEKFKYWSLKMPKKFEKALYEDNAHEKCLKYALITQC